MTQKRWKTCLALLLVLMIASLFTVSLTFARYTQEEESDGMFGGEIDYVVADQLTVRTPEDFITAIENGYTNIQIDNDAEDPFTVISGVTDVVNDLVLDLNGHVLQRVNRDPMLNIRAGVRLTIVDSSPAQTGTMYNPVGSVLHSDGGVLTVASGVFESGPRKTEYVSAQTPPRGARGRFCAGARRHCRRSHGEGVHQGRGGGQLFLLRKGGAREHSNAHDHALRQQGRQRILGDRREYVLPHSPAADV